jgi:hypothetical protein
VRNLRLSEPSWVTGCRRLAIRSAPTATGDIRGPRRAFSVAGCSAHAARKPAWSMPTTPLRRRRALDLDLHRAGLSGGRLLGVEDRPEQGGSRRLVEVLVAVAALG